MQKRTRGKCFTLRHSQIFGYTVLLNSWRKHTQKKNKDMNKSLKRKPMAWVIVYFDLRRNSRGQGQVSLLAWGDVSESHFQSQFFLGCHAAWLRSLGAAGPCSLQRSCLQQSTQAGAALQHSPAAAQPMSAKARSLLVLTRPLLTGEGKI